MNCKPGDLAVVLRDAAYPENVGAFVIVLDVELALAGEWRCESLCDMSAEYVDGRTIRVRAGHEIWLEDRDLKPIRGSKTEVESKTNQLEIA